MYIVQRVYLSIQVITSLVTGNNFRVNTGRHCWRRLGAQKPIDRQTFERISGPCVYSILYICIRHTVGQRLRVRRNQ